MPTATRTPFATVEAAVEDIRAGRFVVVVDDPDRENEGDLVIAAQFAGPVPGYQGDWCVLMKNTEPSL